MPLNLRLAFCNVVYGESSLAYIVVICNDIIKHSSLFFFKGIECLWQCTLQQQSTISKVYWHVYPSPQVRIYEMGL